MKTKKLCAVLICLILLAAVLPVSAYADYTIHNGEIVIVATAVPSLTLNDTLTIEAGGVLNISTGFTLTIGTSGVIINNGTISGPLSNLAAIRNNGKISGNGDITVLSPFYNNLNGAIDYNSGSVTENNGAITENDYEIQLNNGAVTTNNFSRIIGTNAGTVENNFGTVNTNTGTVTNNYGGTVGGVAAVNNYYEATVTGDHTANTLTVANGKLWLKSGGSAVFTPQAGYVIKNAVSSNPDATFINNNGVWTLTATGANSAATAVTLTVEAAPAGSSVPHTGSDRQTGLMLTLALLSGAVLAYGVVKRKRSA